MKSKFIGARDCKYRYVDKIKTHDSELRGQDEAAVRNE